MHGYADTDLETLIGDMKKEEDNLCAHRGLIPGTTNQTFIALLSSSFREIYYKILDSPSTVSSKINQIVDFIRSRNNDNDVLCRATVDFQGGAL